MTRYNNHSGSGTGSGNNDADYDDTTLKLQKYSAIRATPIRVTATDTKYGDRFIVGMDDGSVLDGIVFQRDDDPDTWKTFGFGELGFHVGQDGSVYEQYDSDADEFSGEMSAADVLSHARIQGFQEKFGDTTYWYTPVGVVIEANEDIAVNVDIEFDVPEDEIAENAEIPIGEISMLLSNKSWVRAFAKLLTETGNNIIATEENEEGDIVAVSDSHDWLTTMDPELREELEGREVELFIIQESATFGDDEVTYTTPILLDAKTDERITLNNSESESEDEQESEQVEAEPEQAVADGGTATETQGSDAEPAAPDTPDEPTVDADADADLPDALNDLVDYFAKTQPDVGADEFRDFAEDEVEDADNVDWNAAVAEVQARA